MRSYNVLVNLYFGREGGEGALSVFIFLFSSCIFIELTTYGRGGGEWHRKNAQLTSRDFPPLDIRHCLAVYQVDLQAWRIDYHLARYWET